MTNIELISALGTLLAKKYSKDLFKLLSIYKDISASEASSRLGLHVQTVQEFLETTVAIGLSTKTEAIEKKRPYYRYTLTRNKLDLRFDITELVGDQESSQDDKKSVRYREKKNSNAHFTVARSGNYFSTISVMEGAGRERKHRKINLTNAQGKFLFHLPFPDALALSIDSIVAEAEVNEENKPEIEDIVTELINLGVIEEVT